MAYVTISYFCYATFNLLKQGAPEKMKSVVDYLEESYSSGWSARGKGRGRRQTVPPRYVPKPVSYTHLDVYKRQAS